MNAINESYNCFIDKYQKLFNFCFPYKKLSRKKSKHKKWITRGLLVSIRHKNRLYKKYLDKPNNETRRVAYRRYSNKLTNILRLSEKHYYTQLLLKEKTSSHNLWKVYRQLMGKKSRETNSAIEKVISKNRMLTDKLGISNEFNNYFCKIGENLSKSIPENENYRKYLINDYPDSMFLYPITKFELSKEISKLPTNKAPGYDEITSKVVKLTSDYILTPLTYIFNLSLSEGIVPESFKTAKVIPIYKKKNKYDPTNDRPISLLSIFNKLLEKLMHHRLYSFLNKYNILYKHQFGFRENHSTTLAIIEIVDTIREELDKGNSVIATYLDLTKAFDTVNLKILLHKLKHYGIRGLANKWFYSYLTDRKQFTKINGINSDKQSISTGIPQGSVLGPLLFLLYMNDIAICTCPWGG